MTEPSRLTIPTNFGVENLESQFHNNASLLLRDGEPFGVNSIIISYNSPVFKRLFLELNQSAIEMDDYTPDIVRCFIRALYAGNVHLNHEKFREVNKLGKVFEVKWVKEKCTDFYAGLLEKVDSNSTYSSLIFLVEEAIYARIFLEEASFTERFTEMMCHQEKRYEMFIKPFMREYGTLENSQLDLAISVSRPDPACILKILKINLEKQGYVFDAVSRYLLQNTDLCDCIEKDEELFEEIFDLLNEKSPTISADDIGMINKKYRTTRKEHKQRKIDPDSQPPSGQHPDTRHPDTRNTGGVQEPGLYVHALHYITKHPVQILVFCVILGMSQMLGSNIKCSTYIDSSSTHDNELRHIFSPIDEFRGIRDVDGLLRYISDCQPSSVRNLYDLIDTVFLVCQARRVHNIENHHVKNIIVIRKSRGWKRVHSNYLKSWYEEYTLIAEKLSKLYGSDLISDSESHQVIGKWGHYNRKSEIASMPFFTSKVSFQFNLDLGERRAFSFKLTTKPHDPWFGNFSIELNKAVNLKPDNIHLAVKLSHKNVLVILPALLSWRNVDGNIVKDADDGWLATGSGWLIHRESELTLYAFVF